MRTRLRAVHSIMARKAIIAALVLTGTIVISQLAHTPAAPSAPAPSSGCTGAVMALGSSC